MKYIFLTILGIIFTNNICFSQTLGLNNKIHFIFSDIYYNEDVTIRLNGRKIFSGKINNGKRSIAKEFCRKIYSGKCDVEIEIKGKDCLAFESNIFVYNKKHIYITLKLVNAEGLLYIVETEEPVFY